MNRKYTIEDFADKCNILRRYYDRPAITTDVIVGFPGETKQEFETTFSNLEKLGLYEIHVFKYSVRKGTVAERMPDQVPEEIKNIRSDCLLKLTARQKLEYEKSLEGITDEALIEEVLSDSPKGTKVYTGYTKRYVRINFESTQDIVNKIITYTF